MTDVSAGAVPPEFNVPGVQFWEIAAGDGGYLWDEWKNDDLVGIGWNDLGDLSGLDWEGFKARAAGKMAEGKRGVRQVWRLVHSMRVGDIVLARAGWANIVGIGVVTGEYRFAPEYDYAHLRPVRWLPIEPRPYNGGRRQTLCQIDAAEARQVWLSGASPKPTKPTPPGPPAAKLFVPSTNEPLNTILYGPPGTGKTWALKERAARLLGLQTSDRGAVEQAWTSAQRRGQVELVTFHPSTSYEEFVEGLRPEIVPGEGGIRYEVAPGLFTRIARRAIAAAVPKEYVESDEEQEALGQRALEDDLPLDFGPNIDRFVLVIDEINRANIARVFGELITLLEDDKRLGGGDPLIVTLPGSKSPFAVPRNLYVIATMNTSDRSIALLDVALRRRFAFEELRPEPETLRNELNASNNFISLFFPDVPGTVVAILETLNARLELMLDREHLIGHAWFMKVRTPGELRKVMARKVIPLLQEYFYGAPDRLAVALGHPCDADGRPMEISEASCLQVRRIKKDALFGDAVDLNDITDVEIHPLFRAESLMDPLADHDEWLRRAFAQIIHGARA